MGVSVIDGTIEAAVLKRAPLNLRIYQYITFRLADGGTRMVQKAVTDAGLGPLLVPGTSGRFYLFTTPDQRGVHGVRDDKGAALFAFPRNNEKAMLYVSIIGGLIFVAMLALDKLSGWAILCLAIGIPFHFIYRSTRLAAQRQFEADAGYRPTAAP